MQFVDQCWTRLTKDAKTDTHLTVWKRRTLANRNETEWKNGER